MSDSQLTFKPATRQSIKPLIGLLGVSGGGKTLSALLLGRGLVGPSGKLGLLDTENGRGSVFSDMVPGGYLYLELGKPFSPERYIEMLGIAEREGIECLVIDSATHEWAGPGGYLEMKEEVIERMAGNDFAKRDRCAIPAAARVKPKHNRFVDHVLRYPGAVILCFRGKVKVDMKQAGGRMRVEKDEALSAIQDSGLMFEMLVAGEVHKQSEESEGGFFRCTKHTHPKILPLLPKAGEQLGVKHGEAIAAWARGETPAPKPAPDERKALKRKLWTLTETMHNGQPSELLTYLLASGWVTKDDTLESLSAEQLTTIIGNVEAELKGAA